VPKVGGTGPNKAEGTNKGHENGEAMAFVGFRLTAQLGLELHILC
jgi:hypothetical protein